MFAYFTYKINKPIGITILLLVGFAVAIFIFSMSGSTLNQAIAQDTQPVCDQYGSELLGPFYPNKIDRSGGETVCIDTDTTCLRWNYEETCTYDPFLGGEDCITERTTCAVSESECIRTEYIPFTYSCGNSYLRTVDCAPYFSFSPEVRAGITDNQPADKCYAADSGVVSCLGGSSYSQSLGIDYKYCGLANGSTGNGGENGDGGEDPPPQEPVCGNGSLEGSEQCDLGSGNGPLPSTCSNSCTINDISNPDENTLQLQSDPNFTNEIPIETSEGTFDTDDTITTETDYGNQSFFVTAPEEITRQSGRLFTFTKWVIDGALTRLESTTNFTLDDTNSTRTAVVFYEETPVCGNGIVESGEECDGGDICTASCQFTECSDGIDNDDDDLIDEDDPSCTGGGGGSGGGGGGTYDPGDNSEDEPFPVVWIDATPKLVAKGGTSLLDWGVTNLGDIASITCTSDSDPDQPDWIDNATTTAEGSRTVEPTSIGITTYSITCTNSEDESGSDSVTVIIPFIQEVLP